MTEDEARQWLAREVGAASRPELDSTDLDDLLRVARVPDSDDNAPSSDDWTPTFSAAGLYAAAEKGWRRKAGRAAHYYTFSSDGQRFDRAQIHAHCLRMAESYRSGKVSQTRTIGTPTDVEDVYK